MDSVKWLFIAKAVFVVLFLALSLMLMFAGDSAWTAVIGLCCFGMAILYFSWSLSNAETILNLRRMK